VSLVLDSSVAIAWCFVDEQTPTLMALLGQVAESGAESPALRPLEVANTLFVAERRKRLDAAERDRMMAFLRDFPVALGAETAGQAWTATALLAERHGLTVYDAAYLELARRRDLPLATLDTGLRRAAERAGAVVLATGR